jgi:hypothetical protein
MRDSPAGRDDEDDAVVLVLQDVGLFALMDARHYHVAALDEANAAGISRRLSS